MCIRDRNVSNGENTNEELFKIGPAPQFELTNQNNQKITNNNYKGKVYVLEFFFTTCPTICPRMNQSMKKIEQKFHSNPHFGLASITINPEHDTSQILLEHSQQPVSYTHLDVYKRQVKTCHYIMWHL